MAFDSSFSTTSRRQIPGALYVVAIVMICSLSAACFYYHQALTRSDQTLAQLRGNGIDVGFAQFMGRHHEQAIMMAHLLLDGRPTQLRSIAQNIAADQLLELGQMRAWLELWQQPIRPQTQAMDWMLLGPKAPDPALTAYLLDCKSSPEGMPGLASLAELNALRGLEGRARDIRFLEMMLAHHRGGLPMAQFAAQLAQVPSVRHLAGRIVQAQAQEIATMQSLLAAMQASRD